MPGAAIRAAASSAAPNISQTAFIFAAVGFAFLFFVTIRGDLPKWLGLLGLAGTTAPAPIASPGASGSGSAAWLGQALPDVLAGQQPALPTIPAITPGTI